MDINEDVKALLIETAIKNLRYHSLTQAMAAAEMFNALGDRIVNVVPGELLPEYQFKLVRHLDGRWVVAESIDGD